MSCMLHLLLISLFLFESVCKGKKKPPEPPHCVHSNVWVEGKVWSYSRTWNVRLKPAKCTSCSVCFFRKETYVWYIQWKYSIHTVHTYLRLSPVCVYIIEVRLQAHVVFTLCAVLHWVKVCLAGTSNVCLHAWHHSVTWGFLGLVVLFLEVSSTFLCGSNTSFRRPNCEKFLCMGSLCVIFVAHYSFENELKKKKRSNNGICFLKTLLCHVLFRMT